MALPAGTVTLGTICTRLELLARVTQTPLEGGAHPGPAGAADARMIVALTVDPPPTVTALRETPTRTGTGTTASVAVCVELFTVAVIVTFT